MVVVVWYVATGELIISQFVNYAGWDCSTDHWETITEYLQSDGRRTQLRPLCQDTLTLHPPNTQLYILTISISTLQSYELDRTARATMLMAEILSKIVWELLLFSKIVVIVQPSCYCWFRGHVACWPALLSTFLYRVFIWRYWLFYQALQSHTCFMTHSDLLMLSKREPEFYNLLFIHSNLRPKWWRCWWWWTENIEAVDDY